jgi:hypothetical protein
MMAGSKLNLSKRQTEVGASNIETELQADMLRGLQQAGIDRGRLLLGAFAS